MISPEDAKKIKKVVSGIKSPSPWDTRVTYWHNKSMKLVELCIDSMTKVPSTEPEGWTARADFIGKMFNPHTEKWDEIQRDKPKKIEPFYHDGFGLESPDRLLKHINELTKAINIINKVQDV